MGEKFMAAAKKLQLNPMQKPLLWKAHRIMLKRRHYMDHWVIRKIMVYINKS
jgi:hypothetical protein